MNILHINSYYLDSLFYKNMYECQIQKQLNISVYVPISKNKKIKEFDYGNYTTISKNHNKYDRLLFYYKHKKILNDIQNKYTIEDFDIIHTHSLFSNGYIAYKLHQKYKIPYIVTVRNTDINIFFKKMFFLRKLGIEILKNAEKIIFLSPSYKRNLFKKYLPKKIHSLLEEKILVIPNGIDNFWIKNHIKKPKTLHNNNSIHLIYVGRINKNKNVITTIKVCHKLIHLGYHVQFTIVGKVENKRIFKKIIKEDFVNYISETTKESLLNIYRENEIFIMPSLTESFGLVYAEAITQGLPVIYSKDEGFDGQFKEGFIGYHVEKKDVNDIVKKILLIITNYSFFANHCFQYYHYFNWPTIIDKYLEIYQELNE